MRILAILFRRLADYFSGTKSIKLVNVPCEYSEHFNKKSDFAIKVNNVLKRISFPNRERMIISINEYGKWAAIKIATEVTDTTTGGSIELSHNGNIETNSTDQEIAAQLFVLFGQFAIHEFMENYRYEGKTLFDPHQDGGRFQQPIFNAIKDCTTYKPEDPLETAFTFVVKIPEIVQEKEQKSKAKSKDKFWHKFVPERQWNYKVRKSA